MSNKVISILLSAAMLVATLCVGFGAVAASADENTYTYYFLAPDNYFKTDKGAYNDKVGAYWWTGEPLPGAWPGVEMTAAPEVGDNIFKVDVPKKTVQVIFNAGFDAQNDPELLKQAHQTEDIGTEGYEGDECPYDDDANPIETDNFDGWVYVLKIGATNDGTAVSDATTTAGAWFKLDDYKNYDEYYGTYGFAADNGNGTTDNDTTSTTGKWHAGDTVEVAVNVDGLAIDGADANLAAYNIDLTYDTAAVEYVKEAKKKQYKLDGGLTVVNDETAGTIKLAIANQDGYTDEDYNGEGDYAKPTTAVIKFNVLKYAADDAALGIAHVCTSLSAVSPDGGTPKTLVGVNNPEDPYTAIKLYQICPHETETDTDVETDNETPVSSVVESTPATSSVVESKVESKTESKVESKVESTVESTPTASTKTESTVSKTTSSKAATSSTSSTTSSKKETNDNATSSKAASSKASTTGNTSNGTSVATVATAGTFAVVTLVVILMAAAAVVLYTRKKTEE